ncbi:MAG: dockerin type I domain-containing protein [Oscillospiraceae bacterium]|nr:dockerin type I domain-containing protein [Oscillospiraceae bacterium]
MNIKVVTASIIAGCICLSGSYIGAYISDTAYAYTQYASIRGVSVKKDAIAIGEKVQLELEWSNGAKQEVTYTSSDKRVADVDTAGMVTGISDGTAVITAVIAGRENTGMNIAISVSKDIEESVVYNTSELSLGAKLKKYDTVHYVGNGAGSYANVVNTKGGYDLVFINEKDYVLPFDAELVGIDGLAFYIAPQLDGITYEDARTLEAGDLVDRNKHLLCYDYHINNRVLPVFLPEYYEKYIGDDIIRVKAIDHEKKTITLESVSAEEYIKAKVPDNNTQRIWVVDHDTGKLIRSDNTGEYLISFHTEYETEYIMQDGSFAWATNWGPASKWDYSVQNPYVIDTSGFESGFGVLGYEVIDIDLPREYYLPDDYFEGTHYNNNSSDIKIKLRKSVSGDVSGDGSFSIADVALLTRWQLNMPDNRLVNWRAADLNDDGQLNILDHCLMKHELLEKNKADVTT